MLEGGERLADDGELAVGKGDEGAEIVFQLRVTLLPRVSPGIDAHGITRPGQVPAGQVEEVNRLLEDPVADALDVVAPTVRAETVWPPPQLDEHIERPANRAL